MLKLQTFPWLAKKSSKYKRPADFAQSHVPVIMIMHDDILPIATSQSWCNPSAPIKCLYARAIWHRALSLAAQSSKYFQPWKKISQANVKKVIYSYCKTVNLIPNNDSL